MTEEKIRVLFTDKILPFFAAHPDEVCVGGRGNQLIFYQVDKLIDPEDTPAFIEEGLEVFRLFASSQPSRRQLAPLRGTQPHLAIKHCQHAS